MRTAATTSGSRRRARADTLDQSPIPARTVPRCPFRLFSRSPSRRRSRRLGPAASVLRIICRPQSLPCSGAVCHDVGVITVDSGEDVTIDTISSEGRHAAAPARRFPVNTRESASFRWYSAQPEIRLERCRGSQVQILLARHLCSNPGARSRCFRSSGLRNESVTATYLRRTTVQ